MKYSSEEVMQFIEEEDIKFIRLAFCDIYGRQKNISVMPNELPHAFESGIIFDRTAIEGFGGDGRSDLLLHPDPDTIAILPWRPEHGRVARMFCTISYPDGTPFERDCRGILKDSIAKATKKGYTFSFGSEMEFYLFRLDEDGNDTRIPYDQAGYMDIAPEDKGENVRREICLTLEQMDIQPECSHHEEGPGQNEIDFCYSEALKAADDAVTFQSVVKTIAHRNGLCADFSPKPLKDKPGNGFHINVSVHGGKDEDTLLKYIIGGILDKIGDMTIFFNPKDESYERLGLNKSPGYISWSHENRSQLIRVPAARGDKKRIELRSPDPSANPYLTFALLIEAGLYGIENRIVIPENKNIDLFKADKSEVSDLKMLSNGCRDAAKQAGGSAFVKEILPEGLIKEYCK